MSTPSKKRIHADIRELQKCPSYRYHAEPLEENIFEWHFTIRGPKDTAFEGGVYHGRILLPADYPFKPPNIIFLTENGRFKVGQKICLSISAHHPEFWQPAWGIRLILEALISFLPTPGNGALGSLDWTEEERKRLAKKSLEFSCSICDCLVKDLLKPIPKEGEINNDSVPDDEIMSQISQLHMHRIRSNSVHKEEEKKNNEETKTNNNNINNNIINNNNNNNNNLSNSNKMDKFLFYLTMGLILYLGYMIYTKINEYNHIYNI